MKRSLFLFALLLMAAPLYGQSSAAASADSAAIRNTALDYIEGWYTGNAERMERALHPNLAKRIVVQRERNGRAYSDMVYTSALALVQQTRAGGGTSIPKDRQKTEVRILDIYGHAASVKVDAGGWVDYMHIAKWNGEWKIVNVLWELNPGH